MSEFEWDEEKHRLNIQKHGIGFSTAARIFEAHVLTRIDDRNEYGEVREQSIGTINGVVILVVIHTDRNDKTRIISARRANNAERKRYEKAIQQRTQS